MCLSERVPLAKRLRACLLTLTILSNINDLAQLRSYCGSAA
jgi:hypothetical protein